MKVTDGMIEVVETEEGEIAEAKYAKEKAIEKAKELSVVHPDKDERIGYYAAGVFINAIPGTGGIITAIAKRVGCSWSTAKKYITTMPTVRQAYLDECETATDMAETVLMKAIQKGDVRSARWYLERKRGEVYTRHTELQINAKNMQEMSDDELLAIIEG